MGILHWCFRGVALLGIAIPTLAAAAKDATPTPAVIAGMAFIQPASLVDIGNGRRMNIYWIGHGSLTVIFEAALGELIRSWAMLQPTIAHETRACSYDRSGLGFRHPSGRHGTAANTVDYLHRSLTEAGINPPYVLVGYSLGGI